MKKTCDNCEQYGYWSPYGKSCYDRFRRSEDDDCQHWREVLLRCPLCKNVPELKTRGRVNKIECFCGLQLHGFLLETKFGVVYKEEIEDLKTRWRKLNG